MPDVDAAINLRMLAIGGYPGSSDFKESKDSKDFPRFFKTWLCTNNFSSNLHMILIRSIT